MKLTLKKKLLGGFVAVAVAGVLTGAAGLFGLGKSSDIIGQLESKFKADSNFLLEATSLARSSQVHFKIQVQEWKNVLLRGGDQSQYDKYFGKFETREGNVQESLVGLSVLLRSRGLSTEKVSATIDAHRELGVKYREALKSYDSANPAAHRIVDKLVKGIDRAPTKQIDEIVDFIMQEQEVIEKKHSEEFITYQAEISWMSTATGIGMAVGFVLAVGLGFWMGGSIAGKVGSIAWSLMQRADTVEAASSEVAQFGESVANSTSSDVTAVQEASASLESLISAVRDNSESAQTAKEIANQTRSAVDDGKLEVDKMRAAMAEIRESSKGISNILSTINDIAFQTNILALNAAVEAARAGEAGAGFAVVADEVRNLAQRSAQAASQTSSQIEAAIASSERGESISKVVAESLEVILEKAKGVDEIVASIAGSVSESSVNLDQVSQAINRLDLSSQSNAAATVESEASAKELKQQAVDLKALVEKLVELSGGLSSLNSKPVKVPVLKSESQSAGDPFQDFSRGGSPAATDADVWS